MWHRDDREEDERQTPFVGRPRGAAWRALQVDGVLWEAQALLVGTEVDLAIRLIVTHHRLGFARGGEIVLDLARAWLRPAPVMRPDGTLLLSITADESDEREEIVLRLRDGDAEAFHLLELLTGKRHAAARSDVQRPPRVQHLPPLPDTVRTEPAMSAHEWERGRSLAAPVPVSPDDPFGAHAPAALQRSGATADPVLRQSPPPAAIGDDRDWNMQPLRGMVPQARRRRRGWVFRLGGLLILLTAAALIGTGQVPSRITDRLAERPQPTAVIQVAASDSEPTPDPDALVVAAVATSDAALDIGVGGSEPMPTATAISTAIPAPPAQAAAPTATAEVESEPTAALAAEAESTEVAEEAAPTAVIATQGPETPLPETAVPAPTTRSVPTLMPSTALPSPAAEAAPTLPAETPAPTETAPQPTVPSTEEPEAEPTSEPTEEETAPAATESATEDVTAAAETETAAATATSEAATEPASAPAPAAATEEPTSAPTETPPVGTQGPSVALNQLPAQVITASAVRFTVEAAQIDASLPEFGLPTATDGEWVAVLLDARNTGESEIDIAMPDFTLRAEPSGETAALDVGTEVIAGIVGLDPAYGGDDVIALEADQSARLALVFLVPEETDSVTLLYGEMALALDAAIDQTGNQAAVTDDLPELREATVTEVIDGERFAAELGGETVEVRYLGIDAPTRDDCYATEATRANAALAEGQTVWLERERTDTDVLGRLWRDVWIAGPNGDRLLVAALLVEQGAALPDPEAPNVRYAGWIAAAAATAEAEDAGLWSACQEETAAGGEVVDVPAIERLFALAPWREWLRLDRR